MAYRGAWSDGRPPHRGCATERRADGAWCNKTDPWGRYVCTRGPGHTGDHVTTLGQAPPRVYGRWGPNGELTDSEEAGHAS